MRFFAEKGNRFGNKLGKAELTGFIITALLAGILFLSYSYLVFDSFSINGKKQDADHAIHLENGMEIVQSINLPRNKEVNIKAIHVLLGTYGRENHGKLYVELRENDQILETWTVDLSEIQDNKYHDFELIHRIVLKPSLRYTLVMYEDCLEEDGVGVWLRAQDSEMYSYNGTSVEGYAVCYDISYGRVSIWTICVLLTMTLLGFLTASVWKKADECLLMPIIFVVLLFFYYVCIPPGLVPDEPAHYCRAYEISEGKMLSSYIDNDSVGDYLPTGLLEYGNKTTVINASERQWYVFGGSALYAPVTYAPQALILCFAKLFTHRAWALYYSARLGNLVLCAVAGCAALKVTPIAKRLFFLTLISPITLQEMTSVSSDGVIIALTLLLISYVVALHLHKKMIQQKDIILISAICLYLSLSKIVYLVLIAVVLLIPSVCFTRKSHSYLFKAGIVGIAALSNLIWLGLSVDYLVELKPGVDPGAQVIYVLTHPFAYFLTFVRTVVSNSGGWTIQMCGSSLGLLNIHPPEFAHILFFSIFIYELSVFCSESDSMSIYGRFIFLAVSLGGIVLIFTALYVQWTPYAENMIQGIQGRYFLPLVVPFALSLPHSNALAESDTMTQAHTMRPYIYLLSLFSNGVALVKIIEFCMYSDL